MEIDIGQFIAAWRTSPFALLGLAVQATELSWVNAVVEDLRAGRLTWSEAWLRQVAAQISPDLAAGPE